MKSIRSLTRSAKPVISLLIALMVALSLIAIMGTTPALAKATTFNTNLQIPTNLFAFVPCAAGGVGEWVNLGGTLHVLFQTTIDDTGGFHAMTHFQPQGVSGTGSTTGDKYQATGETLETFNGKVGVEDTYVNNFKIIGQGSGNNFLVHENLHYTILANGEITAYLDNFSVECK